MTICIIILLVVALGALAAFQITFDKSQALLRELDQVKGDVKYKTSLHNLAVVRIEQLETELDTMSCSLDQLSSLKEMLELENQSLIEGNLANQALIDDLTDQLRDYNQADSISSEDLEDIHSELSCYAQNLRDYLSNLDCAVEDIENELSRLDSLL